MTELNSNSVVQQRQEFLCAPMGDELAMMNLETGKYLVLDRIATVIWAQLEQPVMVGDLVDRLQARFEVDRARCERDVLTLLQQLSSKGMLHVADAQP